MAPRVSLDTWNLTSDSPEEVSVSWSFRFMTATLLAGVDSCSLSTFVLVYTVFSATDAKRNARDSHVPLLAPRVLGLQCSWFIWPPSPSQELASIQPEVLELQSSSTGIMVGMTTGSSVLDPSLELLLLLCTTRLLLCVHCTTTVVADRAALASHTCGLVAASSHGSHQLRPALFSVSFMMMVSKVSRMVIITERDKHGSSSSSISISGGNK